jgi:hypothetical protein
MGGWGPAWRDYDPSKRGQAAGAPRDRGSIRGAKRCIVDELFNIYDHAVAKASNIKGEFFQSRKEAKRYIYLATCARASMIRPAAKYRGRGNVPWKQVPFALHTTTPAGLKVKVCDIIIDYVYEMVGGSVERDGKRENVWVLVVEDVKPSGGHREDAYLLKKKWFEAEYGLTINEF